MVGVPSASAASYQRCEYGNQFKVSSYSAWNHVYGESQGQIDLWYSPNCGGQNWIMVSNWVPGNTLHATITSRGPYWDWSRVSVPGGAAGPTYAVRAPGNTCVQIGWYIRDNATGRDEGWGQSLVGAC